MTDLLFGPPSPVARFASRMASYHWTEAWRGVRVPRWRHLRLAARYRLQQVIA